MARYILLRVESTATAHKLLDRFASVPAIQVVGLFASSTKFCEGKCNNEGRSKRSRQFGLWFCPVCKLPKSSIMQQPRNLLQDTNLHPRFADIFISVWEPFTNEPVKKYGQEVIDRVQDQVNNAAVRISRSKRRKARKSDGG